MPDHHLNFTDLTIEDEVAAVTAPRRQSS